MSLASAKTIGEEGRYEEEPGGTVADDDISRSAKELRRARIAKPILIIGLLFLIVGISGVFWLSLPRSGTVLLTEETYVRLDGRYFGHISGHYSSSRDASLGFVIWDKHDWDFRSPEHILVSYSNHGELTEFSAKLPASEAYYLYFFVITPLPNQTYSQGYGPVDVEVHWNIWGPTVDYSGACSVLFLLGAVFVLYGDYAGLKLTVKKKREGV